LRTSIREALSVLVWAILLAASLIWPAATGAQTASSPMILEAKIPLGEVSGPIDHLSFDAKRQRLFVAEPCNSSVGVIDLADVKVLHRLTGFRSTRPTQVFVNVPDARGIVVATLRLGRRNRCRRKGRDRMFQWRSTAGTRCCRRLSQPTDPDGVLQRGRARHGEDRDLR
jgi:hypothetical protein